ncbi:MAG TPA: glycosyltransferase [Bryobacteraceae bacterium]|nr:glycosyltransferase [Bryobacteraceae bacterium]
MKLLLRLVALPALLVVATLLALLSALGLALADLAWLLAGRRQHRSDTVASTRAASVVIPNWNGRDLLEKYLPSVEAALAADPGNEIIVVDDGSSDGSAEFVRERFPRVKLVALERNLGFGGGSNAGFRAASNDIVVLLNSDMRVDAGFLQPLLAGFSDELVFAVSCQILFSDPTRLREETGLTEGWWEEGSLRVRHRVDDEIRDLYPCFYGGGGSCAFDRRKFLELGGFDPLFEPFYLEDTDLGYRAWKRGWKVLYQPQSMVYHEHRGTIGKRFTERQIQAVLKKNFILFAWKNIHRWPRLASHFFFLWAGALVNAVFGDSPRRASMRALCQAFLHVPGAVRSRWNAKRLAEVNDDEAFRRPLGGYFHDRFSHFDPEPGELRVLFVSPYPICPPVHGGGVFMYATLRHLVKLAQVHLVALLEAPGEQQAHEELRTICKSAEFPLRAPGPPAPAASIDPHAVREFADPDLNWLIHRQIYLHRIDVLQLEYTALLQYTGRFEHIATAVFEHDIYFQSIARGLAYSNGVPRSKAGYEYLRALRYELKHLKDCDRVQVCTAENRAYLASFLPGRKARIEDGLRAGIDVARYNFRSHGRKPGTMLFLGSFRHVPNLVALKWFVERVLPRILSECPDAQLTIVGSDPPPPRLFAAAPGAVELLGFVEDIRTELERRAVFVCPIRSGSGVRVKLLEAFASGIPVVSTRLGAEGLARTDAEFCLLADEPGEFAAKVVRILKRPDKALVMAERARAEVEANWDMAVLTGKLVESYRDVVREKRSATCRPDPA